MPEVIYYVAASLDGYIAGPHDGLEWLAPFEGASEDYGYADFYASIDAVLLGRRTYDKALGFGEWPYPDRLCWVFTRKPAEAPPPGVTITRGTPRRIVADLEARGLNRAWLVGGGKLAAAFRRAGLITEYIVSIIPVILGGGVPLFAGRGACEALDLVETKSFANGVTQLRYRRAEIDGDDAG